MNSVLSRVILVAALVGGTELAAAQRTFVSAESGNDANPCSLPSPCRNFAAALPQTDPFGEVVALDSGGYGVVTITQSVSLVSPRGVYAGITSFAGNAVTVNAGDTGNVVLRNLDLNSQGETSSGIDVDSAAALHVENCVISEFAQNGILFDPLTADARLYVSDTVVRRCKNVGIYLPARTGLRATLDSVRMQENVYGVFLISAQAVIRKSVASGGTSGFYVQTSSKVAIEDTIAANSVSGFFAGSGSKMALTGCAATSNEFGITADGLNTVVYVSDSTIAANGTAHAKSGGAIITSPINNTLQANGVDNDILTHYGLD